MYMHTQQEYKNYLKHCLNQGIKDIVFKLPNTNTVQGVLKNLTKSTQDVLTDLCVYNKNYFIECNNYQRVFHLYFE